MYRPSNSIPMANLAAGGPGGAGREFGVPPGRGVGAGEDGNLRCEEELRQVQEMPEEEEAEAREMVSCGTLDKLALLLSSEWQVLTFVVSLIWTS